LNLIEAEVPVHYLLNFSRDRMAEAVNAGVEDARAWCRARNIPFAPGTSPPPPPPAHVNSLEFTEVMKGHLHAGANAQTEQEFEAAAAAGKATKNKLTMQLTVAVASVDDFITSPRHEANANGFVESPLIGGRSTSATGTLNILIDAGDPRRKQMKYRIRVTGADGRKYTVMGFKDVSGDTLASAWPETTTLYTTLLDGHVPEGGSEPVLASGVLVIRPEDFFFRQLFSFRVRGPNPAQALARFGAMFLGKLWDVYGHQIGPL
jgi:hypothetical protein